MICVAGRPGPPSPSAQRTRTLESLAFSRAMWAWCSRGGAKYSAASRAATRGGRGNWSSEAMNTMASDSWPASSRRVATRSSVSSAGSMGRYRARSSGSSFTTWAGSFSTSTASALRRPRGGALSRTRTSRTWSRAPGLPRVARASTAATQTATTGSIPHRAPSRTVADWTPRSPSTVAAWALRSGSLSFSRAARTASSVILSMRLAWAALLHVRAAAKERRVKNRRMKLPNPDSPPSPAAFGQSL